MGHHEVRWQLPRMSLVHYKYRYRRYRCCHHDVGRVQRKKHDWRIRSNCQGQIGGEECPLKKEELLQHL